MRTYTSETMAAALERARGTQDEFWTALRDLERATGIPEIDSIQDLRDVELSDLFKADGRQF